MRTNVVVLGTTVSEKTVAIVSNAAEKALKILDPGGMRPINVVLTNDRVIHGLNREFRKVDSPTDVLSFGYDDEDLLGEIVISMETIERQAVEYGHSTVYELVYNLIHGILHLYGYDHETPDEKRRMMEEQESLMRECFPREEVEDESQTFPGHQTGEGTRS